MQMSSVTLKSSLLLYCLLFIFQQTSLAGDTRRIIGGRDAISGDWPWMVSINSRYGVHCGGSLVAPHWVVTAAHCFDGIANPSQDLSIYLNFIDQLRLDSADKHTIKQVFVHPQWDTYNMDSPYDIAMVQLETASEQTPVYADIADHSQIETGRLTQALGWGVTKAGSYANSRYLQQVTLPVVGLEKCQAAYDGIYTLFDGQLCAGLESGGKDGCAGDSGAPLIGHDGNDWRLLGLSSFGGTIETPCAGVGLYGVYSRVHYYRDFMRQHLYQRLSFSHSDKPTIGTHFSLDLAEQNDVPRPDVDLWVLLEVLETQQAYFLGGGKADSPLLSETPQVWQTNIDSQERSQALLSLTLPQGLAGDYRVYAVYIDTGKALESRYQRSEIAVHSFTIVD